MSTDHAFEPYWLDEAAGLITHCVMPQGEDNVIELNWIGRLFGFEQATTARMLALVGDPDVPTYEILFSFDSRETRQELPALVLQDGHASPDEEGMFMVPTHDEIKDARPIGSVLPEHQPTVITAVGMMTFQGPNKITSDADA